MVTAAATVTNALSATAPSANASSKAGDASGNQESGLSQDVAHDFMQLITGLLNDSATATPANAQATTTTTPEKKSDQPDVSGDATATPEWLALNIPLMPAAVNAASPGNDAAINALATGDAANNALLAQGLNRLTNASGSSKSDKVSNDTALPAFITDDKESAIGALLGKADPGVMLSNALLQANDPDHKANNKLDAVASASHNSAEQLQQMGLMQTSIADNNASVAPAQYTIRAHLGSPEWAAELGNKLSMMVTDKVQSASLQLTPDNMGPVQVKIDINDKHASVWFTADQADTRTALEQSLPKLRELFASQGMSLTDAGVFGQHSQQQAAAFSGGKHTAFGMTDMSGEPTVTQAVLKIGLLDTYA